MITMTEAGCYISSLFTSQSGRSAPQAVQNLVIRTYCERMALNYSLSKTEYSYSFCFPVFRELIKHCGVSGIKDIVLYSQFNLPENRQTRTDIFRLCKQNGLRIHFAAESFSCFTLEEYDNLEACFLVAPIAGNWSFQSKPKI